MSWEDLNFKTTEMSANEILIIVNAREHTWLAEEISYEQVVILAFGRFIPNNNTIYSVLYKRGQGNKPEGTMVKGDNVHVKDKMIFNVTATDKS